MTDEKTSYSAAFFKKLVRNGGFGLGAADFSRLPAKMQEIAFSVHGVGKDDAARWSCLQDRLKENHLDPFLTEIISADVEADLSNLANGAGWASFDLVDVMSEELPPIEWLVKPYLPRPSVTAWFGKPKSLKSLLVLDMCLHVSGGRPWLTTPQGKDGLQVNRARVVWVDLENGSATFKRRMKAIARAVGIEQERGQMLAFSMPIRGQI